MIIYLKNDEIDRVLWDNCIKNSAVTKPYPYSWYLDIMSPGWEALVDDDYDSVFPVPSQTRFGVQYAVTPAFIQQLGAFSPDKPAADVIVEFLDFMPEIYKLTDLCVGQKVEYQGYKVLMKPHFQLNLSPDYESLYQVYTPECRKIISDSGSMTYELSDNITPEELVRLCLSHKRANISGVKQADYDRLTELINYSVSNGKGRITGVREEGGGLLYGLFLIKIPGSITMILEAATQESVERHINYFVTDEIIKRNASTQTILNFAPPINKTAAMLSHPFGGKFIPYYRIYRNRLFWPVRTMK